MMVFLTQLLPLLVFIVVDAVVTDVRISIASAIVFAVVQLAVTWVRRRRFDWFVLVDVGLIGGLGALSIVFDNELFFTVKPALIEAVTVVIMLALLIAPDRFLAGYLGRLMPGGTLRPDAMRVMTSLLGWTCGLTAVHIGAVLFTATQCSRTVWAAVSGPGYYVALIPVIGVALRHRANARRSPDGR